MKVSVEKLQQHHSGALYLYGQDRDMLFETAEQLLTKEPEATQLRVDISELGRIEIERNNQGLFGPKFCHALIRNAESATLKQGKHLLALIHDVNEGDKLIICAPEVSWKKALHKTLLAEKGLVQCEFKPPSPAEFRRWFIKSLDKACLKLDETAIEMVVDHLCGLRTTTRQLIERLRLYDNGQGDVMTLAIVGELIGERAPEDIGAWCHAVAARKYEALSLLHRLLYDQHISEVQLISWLGIRLQQLLMFRWHQAQKAHNPLQAAKVFGDARQFVADESTKWKVPELIQAMSLITDAEKLLKGASTENKNVVLEQLTLKLLNHE
ncbi:MAG: hypothetical protein R8M38_02105 [Mariprofundaceae bacterium]